MADLKRAALFVTCLGDQILPEIGTASVRLLQRAGYDVVFPEEQTCCGQPFFNSGFRRQAVDLAKKTIEVFEVFDTVVLPSGSCTAMIRVEYPHLFETKSPWKRRAEELASKTYELSEFLIHKAQWMPAQQPNLPGVTYHDSCHMCRHLEIKDEPRRLLASAGYPIIEMEESDRCCGFGGLFSVRLPEVSNAMTLEKLRQAVETGSKILVTADPGCLIQMRGMLDDPSFRIEHVATILEGGIE
ncbi:MAG: hypothetical protein GTO18_16485 [Anaerolineales bacterium]|nr:hypothetical protein [Anaerolineales bacterium]